MDKITGLKITIPIKPYFDFIFINLLFLFVNIFLVHDNFLNI